MMDRSARRTFRRWFVFFLFVLLLALVSAGVYAFLHGGEWLVREDPLERAQAAVVLSGGLPDRALAAAYLFRQSYADEIWLTQPLQPGAAMQQLHLPYAGEEAYSRMVLIAQGVPPPLIRVLPQPVLNTADELNAIAQALDEQSRPATAIVVTSRAHTRRVATLWKRIAPGHRGRLVIRAAPQDPFDAQHWWRTTADALTVVREYLGLLNAWAGLPLPHSQETRAPVPAP